MDQERNEVDPRQHSDRELSKFTAPRAKVLLCRFGEKPAACFHPIIALHLTEIAHGFLRFYLFRERQSNEQEERTWKTWGVPIRQGVRRTTF